MVKTKTEQAIIDALEAVAPQHDVDIVDVELVGATKAPCVRVRIEGAEGRACRSTTSRPTPSGSAM